MRRTIGKPARSPNFPLQLPFELVNTELTRIAFGYLLRGRFRFPASQIRLLACRFRADPKVSDGPPTHFHFNNLLSNFADYHTCLCCGQKRAEAGGNDLPLPPSPPGITNVRQTPARSACPIAKVVVSTTSVFTVFSCSRLSQQSCVRVYTCPNMVNT
jgi:hypothetical protein